jgi:transposase
LIRVKLDPAQRQELQGQTFRRGTSPQYRFRLEMLRLADAGLSAPAIGHHLQCREETVRRWLQRFLEEGFSGLEDRPRPGRPQRVTAEHLQALEDLLDASPKGWSAPQLAQWLQERFGLEVTPDHLSDLLQRRGFRWKRSKRWVGYHRQQKPQDQELYERKKEQLQALKRGHSVA